eukprot:TRINITY_DN2755_c0_g1_i11.p1 TRINITY_DN2755_c0_g1~~TRINITY_DN2755_c0_g1_i11.p1  ORF type:complete len:105 (+),score=13.40 TRINITY_DN2755_c0_g1_i11:158-472(+)
MSHNYALFHLQLNNEQSAQFGFCVVEQSGLDGSRGGVTTPVAFADFTQELVESGLVVRLRLDSEKESKTQKNKSIPFGHSSLCPAHYNIRHENYLDLTPQLCLF